MLVDETTLIVLLWYPEVKELGLTEDELALADDE